MQLIGPHPTSNKGTAQRGAGDKGESWDLQKIIKHLFKNIETYGWQFFTFLFRKIKEH
jgi:hypothetical protein